MAPSSDSSSDDDYDYSNAAARLKALKKQTRKKPKAAPRPPPPAREVPKETPALVVDNPSLKDTRVEPVRNGSVKSVTSGSQCVDSDEVESISDESSHPDEVSVPSDDSVPRNTMNTPIEILDSPPATPSLNISNLEELDDSIIEETTVRVSIRWRSNKIESMQLDKHEPLMTIFQKFADQENIPVNRVIFYRRDIPIKPTDSPASLKLSIIDVLEGGIISANTSNDQGNEEEEDDEDICKIKAQVSAKKSILFKLRKDEPFKRLREHCAKELEVPVEKIKFQFDGDDVADADTPDILDLDDEACIDVKILT